jgi:hypothetical protein
MATTLSDDPIERWSQLVDVQHQLLPAGTLRSKALSDCVARFPILHREFLEAYNAVHNKRANRGY